MIRSLCRGLLAATLLVAGCGPEGAIGSTTFALSCTVDTDCATGTPCLTAICDPNLHTCAYATTSSPCSIGNACTVNDACVAGTCIGGDTAATCTACQAVVTLPPGGGSFNGSVHGMSYLKGSCASSDGSPERVFAWTPSRTGMATIQTCGGVTNFDTVLYVLDGQCAQGSPELACNDDTAGCPAFDGLPNSGQHASRIAYAVTAGHTYYIVVDGWGGRLGQFTLQVTPPTICGDNIRDGVEQCDGTDNAACTVTHMCDANCRCVVPATGLPDLVPVITQVSVDFNVTVDPGDVAEGCSPAASGQNVLRFTSTTKNIGTADLVLGDPRCPNCATNPLVACGNPAFYCSPASGHNHAHYSNYAFYELLDATGTIIARGHKQGFCLRDSKCSAGIGPIYTCTNQGITAGCWDDYLTGLGCQYVNINGIAPGTYTLRVRVDPYNRIAELDKTNNVVTVQVLIPNPTAAPPPPDPIPATGGTFGGVTGGMSHFAGSCAASTAQAPEHVFAFTPTASGAATFDTCGLNQKFDSVLYVRDGLVSGNELACNDDTPGCVTGDGSSNADHHGSRVTINVVAGQTYYIVVDGFQGSTGGWLGQFELHVTAPPGSTLPDGGAPPPPPDLGTANDLGLLPPDQSPANDLGPPPPDLTMPPTMPMIDPVPPAGGTFNGVTSGASYYSGSCAASATAQAPEHVFAFTPSASGAATFDTCSLNQRFDSVLYVRGGLVGGTELGCNDDTPGCATGDGSSNAGHHGSRVTLNVVAGQTYYVFVDGYAGSAGGSQGPFELHVTPPTGSPPPPPDMTFASDGPPPSPPDLGVAVQAVPAAGGAIAGSTSGASQFAGTCASASASAPEQVFAWTPSKSGAATVQTCSLQTKFDTVLYVSASPAATNQLACNDDTPGCATGDGSSNADHHGSRVSLNVVAGQTYYLFVDGYTGSNGGSQGAFLLTIVPPP